ncbi:MAG: A24 family peptidase [Maricaulis sp.]|nr:A24 family peptidase [Maricaulis sp.]
MLIHFATFFLLAALLALAIIDARTRRLPDKLTLPLIGFGLATNFYVLETGLISLMGAIIGYGFFWAIEMGYRRFRGVDGLGRGDAKLLAAGGAWCGAWLLPYIVLVAALGGIAHILIRSLLNGQRVDRHSSLALGPWLAIAIGINWLHRIYENSSQAPLI